MRPTLRRFHKVTQAALGLAGGGLAMAVLSGALHPMILGSAVATAVVLAATEFKLRQVEAATLGAWEQVLDALALGLRQQVIASYQRGKPGEPS